MCIRDSGKVTVDWSGKPFPLNDPLVAASSNEVFVGGWFGHGGWIIVAAPLSGRAPARLEMCIRDRTRKVQVRELSVARSASDTPL